MNLRTSHLLLASAIATLAACSTPAQKEQSIAEVRGGSVANSVTPAGSEAVGEWGEARGGLLRTFAFRALERDLLEEGRHYLSQACEADPNDGASHAALARLYLAEGDSSAALVYAERASFSLPDDPQVSMVYAAALSENNQNDKATEVLEKTWDAVATDPEFARSILLHYAAMGETERAKDFLAHEMTEDPKRASTWAASADLMLADGDLEGAIEGYRKALELDSTLNTPSSLDERLGRASKSEDPVLGSARAAEDAGSWQAAENLYRFLVGKERSSSPARLGLARCLSAQERWTEAEVQLSQVPYGVRGWRGHLLQARLDIRAERWGAARGALLLALQERPGLPAAELLLQHVKAQQPSESSSSD